MTMPAGGSSLSGESTIWAACWIRCSCMLSTSGDGMMTAMSPCRSMRKDWGDSVFMAVRQQGPGDLTPVESLTYHIRPANQDGEPWGRQREPNEAGSFRGLEKRTTTGQD